MYMFVLTIYLAVLAYLIMQRFTGYLPATQPPEMNSIAGLGLKPVRHHRGVLDVSTEWCVGGYSDIELGLAKDVCVVKAIYYIYAWGLGLAFCDSIMQGAFLWR